MKWQIGYKWSYTATYGTPTYSVFTVHSPLFTESHRLEQYIIYISFTGRLPQSWVQHLVALAPNWWLQTPQLVYKHLHVHTSGT